LRWQPSADDARLVLASLDKHSQQEALLRRHADEEGTLGMHKSSTMSASGSANDVTASSKETPCFCLLLRALSASQDEPHK
jgi:hypothetical protein